MTTQEQSVKEVSRQDRQDLTDLIVEFVWRLDNRSADTIHELITDDVSLAPGPLLGKDAVIAWGKDRAKVERATSHLMTNFRFHRIDADRVEATSMCLVFRHDGAGVPKATPWAVSEYKDVFVLQDGAWKFASHSVNDVFVAG